MKFYYQFHRVIALKLKPCRFKSIAFPKSLQNKRNEMNRNVCFGDRRIQNRRMWLTMKYDAKKRRKKKQKITRSSKYSLDDNVSHDEKVVINKWTLSATIKFQRDKSHIIAYNNEFIESEWMLLLFSFQLNNGLFSFIGCRWWWWQP